MVCVIGMGPGDIRHLTLYAHEKILNAKCLVAFGRISKTVEHIGRGVIKVTSVDEILRYINENGDVTVLASGDPCFYGILEYLKRSGIEVHEVVPGVSSFQYMMTRLKKSWNGANFISLHGREENLLDVMKSSMSVIIIDSKNSPDSISKKLYSIGARGKMYCGFDLSYPEEKIIEVNIGEGVNSPSSLAVVVVENEVHKG